MLADKAAGMNLAQSGRWQQIYSQQLEQWTVEMLANASLWSGLDRTAYWDRVRLLNPGLSPQSIAFCDTWFARAFTDPTSIANDTAMQTLIVARERRLKGPLARLSNDRAMERWAGASGAGRLDFRWTSARAILVDIQNGLAT